jgi:hypothetical protein
MVAVPEGGAGVVRIVDPRAAAQQLGDPPSTATYALKGDGWSEMKNHSRRLRRHPSATNNQRANSQGKAKQP